RTRRARWIRADTNVTVTIRDRRRSVILDFGRTAPPTTNRAGMESDAAWSERRPARSMAELGLSCSSPRDLVEARSRGGKLGREVSVLTWLRGVAGTGSLRAFDEGLLAAPRVRHGGEGRAPKPPRARQGPADDHGDRRAVHGRVPVPHAPGR